MSKISKLVVTLRIWDVDLKPLYDSEGNLFDMERVNAWESTVSFPRRDYPRGPEGKAELITDLAGVFERNGVDFKSTNNDWAAQPDGPYTHDYREGMEREVTVHFAEGTPAWVVRSVMNEVG